MDIWPPGKRSRLHKNEYLQHDQRSWKCAYNTEPVASGSQEIGGIHRRLLRIQHMIRINRALRPAAVLRKHWDDARSTIQARHCFAFWRRQRIARELGFGLREHRQREQHPRASEMGTNPARTR